MHWASRRGLVSALLALVLAPSLLAAPASRPRMLLLDACRAGPAVVVVGERGSIFWTEDEAATWQRANVPTRATLTGVSFAPVPPPQPQLTGWAVGHDAVILGTTDGGRTWQRQFQGENLQDSFLDVIALDPRRAIAVGAYGLYVSTADGGRTWERRKIREEDSHLNRITVGPTGTLYLAGENGTLLRSADQGASWTGIRSPYEGSFYGIMPLDRRTLLAHGLRGHVFRSVDDGATWQKIDAPQPVLLAAGLQLRSNHLLLAGQARTLLVSRDYGKSFVATDRALPTGIAELIELADNRCLALGEAGATIIPLP
ncbi:MAG: hypothetical protein HZC55_25855 [Verrucomicrobia bacterium]|nr:hypothetical protein [Verrucomicrobiota bacterium]